MIKYILLVWILLKTACLTEFATYTKDCYEKLNAILISML